MWDILMTLPDDLSSIKMGTSYQPELGVHLHSCIMRRARIRLTHCAEKNTLRHIMDTCI